MPPRSPRSPLLAIALLSTLPLLGFDPRAAADTAKADAAAAAYLGRVRALHHAPAVTALDVRMVATNLEHEDLTKTGKPSMRLRWFAPLTARAEVADLPESLRKTVDDLIGFWTPLDLFGGGAFTLLDQCEERSVDAEAGKGGAPGAATVVGAHSFFGPLRARFADGGALRSLELLRLKVTLAYELERVGERWRIESRVVRAGKIALATVRYRELRRVGGHLLPTRMRLLAGEAMVELALADWRLDRAPATVRALSADDRASIVAGFREGWRGWAPRERIRRLRALPGIGGDDVVRFVAGHVRHETGEVARAAADTLAGLGSRGAPAVPALMRALPEVAGDKETYARVANALGSIGDPRAIEVLRRTVIQDRAGWEGFWARARALGLIRDKRAIDALMAMLVSIDRYRYAHVWPLIVEPLKQATGKDFGPDRAKWRKWWRIHRINFVFPGDERLK